MNECLTWKWVKDFCKIEMDIYSDIETKTTTVRFRNQKLEHTLTFQYSAEYLDNHIMMLMISGQSNLWRTNIRMYVKESKLEYLFGHISI